MASIAKFKEWILETIDQLRKRKARPDLERICHMVERRYGALPLQTQTELDRLVEAEIVIKVDYKGSTSYRNAAKWAKRNSLSGQVLNSLDVSRCLVDAVRTLENANEQTPHDSSARKGASIADIANYMAEQNLHVKLIKANKLHVALEREVIAARLLKLPNGNYAPFDDDDDEEDEEEDIVNNDNNNNNNAVVAPVASPNWLTATAPVAVAAKPKAKPAPSAAKAAMVISDAAALKVIHAIPCKKGRPPNKRKRFKKTHGPDFVENYDALFEEPEPKCDYCLLTAACNCNGKAEDLLFCKDCNAKAHPSCMDYSVDLAMRSRMSPWQCMDCKTCYVCDDSGDADCMLFCDACDKGFHMGCHVPPVTEKPSGKWVCCQCSEEIAKKNGHKKSRLETNRNSHIQTVDDALGMPTPCESPVPDIEQNKKRLNHFLTKNLSDNKENNEIPDASDWTIEDVENYFRIVGFPDQACAFKEQEIDGKSLLLLKRSDVLTGLSIKLGPALKIYNHVKRLQTRRADGHLIC